MTFHLTDDELRAVVAGEGELDEIEAYLRATYHYQKGQADEAIARIIHIG